MHQRLLGRAALFYHHHQHFVSCGYNLSPPSLLYNLTNRQLNDGTSIHSRQLTSAAAPSGDEYDYVVVGAGSAGCTIADRLSLSDNKVRMLVTEAGAANTDQSWRVRMPAAIVSATNDSTGFTRCHRRLILLLIVELCVTTLLFYAF